MQRRVIAAVAAVLLAGIGAVLLYNYVNTAETRAMAQMETVEVLVVSRAVPAGTPGASLTPFVELKQLPKIAVVDGALTNLTQLADPNGVAQLVTTSDLAVGEQVVPSRFVQPDTTTTGDVAVPSDMQLLSIPIEAPRAVAGSIKAGDKIGIFVSGDDPKTDDKVTQLALRDVLVVRVLGGSAEGSDTAAASGGLVLTLALTPKDAAHVVFAEENSKVWLALEPKDGDAQRVEVRVATK